MGQSFMERMADPQQAAHLGKVLANRDVEAALAQLESLLVPRRDPLGEALSLARRLRVAPRSKDADALRERLQQTLAELDRMTLKLIIRRSELFNCGLPTDVEPSQRFAFECPRMWETLSPTDDPKVRHCADCQQAVYFEDSPAAVEYRALAGQCVAIPASLADGKFQSLTRDMVGRPNARALWGEALPWRGAKSANQNLLRTPASASVVGHGREAVHSSLLAAGVPLDGFDRRSKGRS
ncbi:MAG TPA: hypothetical protein PKI03_35655 [Pseudomonadota bacterium]|nr:hypothetical protein [Pseudomonadota bacterium]